jgi:hypothetical protein
MAFDPQDMSEIESQQFYPPIQAIHSQYGTPPSCNGFINSQEYSNLSKDYTISSYSDFAQLPLHNFRPSTLDTEYPYSNSMSSSTDLTSFPSEDEDINLEDAKFLQDSAKYITTSSATRNKRSSINSSTSSQRTGQSQQDPTRRSTAALEHVQAGQCNLSLPMQRGNVGSHSNANTPSSFSFRLTPKKAALHRIWSSCSLKTFPNSRKIRALAELAEIPYKTARKWLKEFIRHGLVLIPERQAKHSH